TTGYWNSCTDCQRHMAGFAWELKGVVEVAVAEAVLPFTAAAPMLSAHVVIGLLPATSGYAGVAKVASSTSVQLRLPLPPWPACTNQSRPHGVSTLSVDFLTSFCIEIEPSEQVVWLWTSPATYLPCVFTALARLGMVPIAAAPSAAVTARAIWLLLKLIERTPLVGS